MDGLTAWVCGNPERSDMGGGEARVGRPSYMDKLQKEHGK